MFFVFFKVRLCLNFNMQMKCFLMCCSELRPIMRIRIICFASLASIRKALKSDCKMKKKKEVQNGTKWMRVLGGGRQMNRENSSLCGFSLDY